MLKDANDLLEEMTLIDELQHLGVAYHFENEINEALRRIFYAQFASDDLHMVALRFRLLRQQGHKVPSDVFDKFKDDKGNFKESLSGDARGLLSLYEAAYLGMLGEDILDEAIKFSRNHLKAMVGHLKAPLASQVIRALETPLHRTMRRLEARQYISIYHEEEARNNVILELAKLDFNLLQLLHRKEIRMLSLWWQELGLTEKLTFARDRLVECYFWILGVYFEPQYTWARTMLAKVICFASVMDDMYDAYGTLEELQLFTDAIQRWDSGAEDQLPEYMKFYYISLSNIIKEFEDEMVRKGTSYRVHYLREAMKALGKAYFEEAKWRSDVYIPKVEEYFSVSLMSSGYPMVACASFIGMGEIATKEVFDWVIGFPKIVRASCIVARLMDDIKSSKLEQEREHVASAVDCYMKEHGTTEQEACKKLQEMVEDAWKVINEECLETKVIAMPLLLRILHFSCMIETIYKYEDGYTNSSGVMKDRITMLLVEPILV